MDLLTDDGETALGGKVTLDVDAGDALSIQTLGGGGYGEPMSCDSPNRIVGRCVICTSDKGRIGFVFCLIFSV